MIDTHRPSEHEDQKRAVQIAMKLEMETLKIFCRSIPTPNSDYRMFT